MGPLGPLGAPWGHLGPIWDGNLARKLGWGRWVNEFSRFGPFLDFQALKKLSLRGRDLSRKIRGEILCNFPPEKRRDLLWRPVS